MKRIYLDYNAATPVDPEVLDAYIRARREIWANASSTHREGQAAKALLAEARSTIASRCNVSSQQVVFFSSATEALTTLIRGLVGYPPSKHIITSGAEHAAVWQLCRRLQEEGADVSFLPVGTYGAVNPSAVQEAITDKTSLISLMSVNNETGVKTDISMVAKIASDRKIPFVVDGVAGLGKEPFQMAPGISAACFSAYKMYAPSGVGFAILAPGLRFQPFMVGGGQELGRRGGSENVPAIYACSLALEKVLTQIDQSASKVQQLRDLFERRILQEIDGVLINGDGPRVNNCSNLAFHGIDGEELLIRLDLAGVAASHGAACSSGASEPSRVLLNMGYSRERALSSVRFSLGLHTTEEEIHEAIKIIKSSLVTLRR